MLMNCNHKKRKLSKAEHRCIIVSLWFSEGQCFVFLKMLSILSIGFKKPLELFLQEDLEKCACSANEV